MTDLEITKACAEAMGLGKEAVPTITQITVGLVGRDVYAYNPLHDDAQAMALVKRFHLAIQPPQFVIPPRWHVWIDEKGVGKGKHTGISDVLNLNRAICECVAKLHNAKLKETV